MREPTRDNHLLDLVITDLDTNAIALTVLPKLADHAVVLTQVRLGIPSSRAMPRTLWVYKEAKWANFCADLGCMDWSWIEHLRPSEAAEVLTHTIRDTARKHIKVVKSKMTKQSHPWLDNECLRLVQANMIAAGTDEAHVAAAECSDGLLWEYHNWVARMRSRLRQLRHGSKEWWKL